jgi:hypothetical protein
MAAALVGDLLFTVSLPSVFGDRTVGTISIDILVASKFRIGSNGVDVRWSTALLLNGGRACSGSGIRNQTVGWADDRQEPHQSLSNFEMVGLVPRPTLLCG